MRGKLIREIVYEDNGDQVTVQFCFRKVHRMAKITLLLIRKLMIIYHHLIVLSKIIFYNHSNLL